MEPRFLHHRPLRHHRRLHLRLYAFSQVLVQRRHHLHHRHRRHLHPHHHRRRHQTHLPRRVALRSHHHPHRHHQTYQHKDLQFTWSY